MSPTNNNHQGRTKVASQHLSATPFRFRRTSALSQERLSFRAALSDAAELEFAWRNPRLTDAILSSARRRTPSHR